MGNIDLMKELVEELNKASDAYYNSGETIMSDKEFDKKLAILTQLEKETGVVLSGSPTQKVGAPVLTKLNKIKHEHKDMLSLEKVHSAEEIVKFANGHDLVAMIKLDGLSIRLTYENGKLVRGETRGNGAEGSDVTEHVKQFKNVPLVIDKEGTYVADGEAIITDYDFEAINAALPEGAEKFKNSRNLASGTLALLDTSLVKERHLRFVLWDVIVGDNSETFEERIFNAQKLGFDTTPTCVCGGATRTDIIELANIAMFDRTKELGYPCDGVVWKFSDVAYGETLGQTSHHFCNAVAFKAKQDEYETALRDIEWSMGKTGILTPVAVFNPVEIDGTEVTRASVHNVSILTELDLRPGDTITVYKANQIIPQIAQNLSEKYHSSSYMTLPSQCPICGGIAELRRDIDTTVLVCTNDDCQGKLLGRLSHFVSKNAINIDGMSEATLEFLINKGWIKSFKDLYIAPFYKEVYAEWIHTAGFGKKSVDNLRAAIEKSRHTTFERFLYAQSIPLIGRTASKDISKFCNGSIDTFCNMVASNALQKLLSIDGFGETMYSSLSDWCENHWIEFLALKSEFVFDEGVKAAETGSSLQGKSFCITGKLEHYANRDELVSVIEQHGGKFVSGVSAKTDYLIINDINSTSGKAGKAKQLGILLISEADFMNMIKTK